MVKWTAPVQRGMRGPALSPEEQAGVDRAVDAVVTVVDYGDRAAKFPSPAYGDRVFVKHAFQIDGIWHSRAFEYREAGSLDLDGEPMPADDWLGERTANEANNIENLTKGNLDLDRVNGAVARLDAADAGIAAVADRMNFMRMKIDSLTVTPSQAEIGDTLASLAFAFSISGGAPNGLVIARSNGQRVTGLAPAERAITATAIPAPAGLLLVGDSQLYNFGPGYASALGLSLAMCALYSNMIEKQAIRLGAMGDIALTIEGGVLPAAGSEATVTLVNGSPTTFLNTDGTVNNNAILHASNPDTATHSMDLSLAVAGGTRAVTLIHRSGSAPNVYKISQASGTAVAVSPDAPAVPAFKAMAQSTHRVKIMCGHNSMSQSDTAGSFDRIRAAMSAIMALCANNPHPVEVDDFWPADTPEERVLIPHILNHSQWLRDVYPANIQLDDSNRTLWERMRNSEMVLKAEYRDSGESLHPNAAGNTEWRAHSAESNALHFAGVAPITGSTSFELSVRGAVPGYDVIEETRTVSLPFMHRVFWGVSASATLNSAGVLALGNSALQTGRDRSFSTSPADQYVYVALPATMGDPSYWRVGAFPGAPVKIADVPVTKANGATVTYNLFRSTNKITGSPDVEVH